MARKARHRISYVLPLPNSSAGGHRLGVNGLAVDQDRSLLYSGGRDGLICVWDFNSDRTTGGRTGLTSPASNVQPSSSTSAARKCATAWHDQIQAHTHWINDIVLTPDKSALVSASSDLTVKLWRPTAEDRIPPQTIGVHRDYVKCLAVADSQVSWVASGGLDHRVSLWDLNGGGQTLGIDVAEEEDTAKGSVYALGVGGGILASGGPENIVRVWDPRSGSRITKFVGHTDNIRDILISAHGDLVMTASSDQTIKVWSLHAGRCLHTLTMHSDSVWSLYSEHPRLSVFYSSDRSGLVAKTTVLGSAAMDEGLCIALCQEHEGVAKVISDGVNFWTATASSSINRWADFDPTAGMAMANAVQQSYQPSSPSRRAKDAAVQPTDVPASSKKQVSLKSVLRLSNATPFTAAHNSRAESPVPQAHSGWKTASEIMVDSDVDAAMPLRKLPEESTEGQHGLIKHILLNDRRRVLTLDTTGEVMMWDLIKCEPLESYGKRHLEDVAAAVNTMESVANWCAVDTRTGRLACVLEENYCFDGEMYADELPNPDSLDFKDDQRINLGKWVLRYLFSALIDEELRRDEIYRNSLIGNLDKGRSKHRNPSLTIQLPLSSFGDLSAAPDTPGLTPRAVNGLQSPTTPGMAIGAATPAPRPLLGNHAEQPAGETALERQTSQHSLSKMTTRGSGDYFSTNLATSSSPPPPVPPIPAPVDPLKTPQALGDTNADDRTAQPPPQDAEKEANGKESGSRFGKKFRIPFGVRKQSRPSSVEQSRPLAADEKAEESDGSRSIDSREFVIEDNFLGVVQKIRQQYLACLQNETSLPANAAISPSLPLETPVLRPPPLTAIIIQEDSPDSGGVADLYWGTVASVGADIDLVEKVAPTWLGDLLLHNQIPYKDVVKISFVLLPWENILPSIAPDGNVRLNANRMLRARKILAYIAERIPSYRNVLLQGAKKPEDELELYCQNQLVPPKMTLATIRAYVWKGAGDVVLYYKGKG